MEIRLAAVGDDAAIAALVERYWVFGGLIGFLPRAYELFDKPLRRTLRGI